MKFPQRIASPKKQERNYLKRKFSPRQARRAELLMRQLAKTYGDGVVNFITHDFSGRHPGRAVLVTNGPLMWATTKRRAVAPVK